MREFEAGDGEIAKMLGEAFSSENLGDGFVAKAMQGYRVEMQPDRLQLEYQLLARLEEYRQVHHTSFRLPYIRRELAAVLDRAQTAGLDGVAAKAAVQLAMVQRHGGELGAARLSAERALELLGDIGDPATRGRAHFELGMLTVPLEEADAHLAEAETCLEELEGDASAALEAHINYARARADKRRGDLHGAVMLLDRSQELYKRAKNSYAAARAASRLGYYLRLAGQFEEAQLQLENALRTAQKEGFKRVEGYAKLELGQIVEARVKDRAGADSQTYLREALALFAEVGDPLGEAHTLAALAALERRRGRLDDAIEHALEAHDRYRARDLADNRRLSGGAALTLRLLGQCLRDARRFTEAEAALIEALGAYEDLGHVDAQAMTLLALAKLKAARGDGRSALDPALKGLDLLAERAGVPRQGTDSNDVSAPHISCYLVAADIANDCNDSKALVRALSGAFRELVLRSIRLNSAAQGSRIRESMQQLQHLERGLMDAANDPGLTDVATPDPDVEDQRQKLLEEVIREDPALGALLGNPQSLTGIIVPVDDGAVAFSLGSDTDPHAIRVTRVDLPQSGSGSVGVD